VGESCHLKHPTPFTRSLTRFRHRLHRHRPSRAEEGEVVFGKKIAAERLDSVF